MSNDTNNQYEAVLGALSRLEEELALLEDIIHPQLKENRDEESWSNLYTKLEDFWSDLDTMMYGID